MRRNGGQGDRDRRRGHLAKRRSAADRSRAVSHAAKRRAGQSGQVGPAHQANALDAVRELSALLP